VASVFAALAATPAAAMEARAMLIPALRTELSSEIAAAIKEITVDFGDTFTKGQPLVRFDCATYDAELRKAEAELAEAEKILDIDRRLARLKSISELELAVAEARANRAKAEVSLRRSVTRKCVVAAPFTGRLTARKAQPHQYVTPGQPLMEIIDHTKLVAQFFVPSSAVRRLEPGTPLRLRIDETGREYPAKITVIGPEVDQVSQSIEVRAGIEGHHPELLAGMSGTAIIDQ